MRDVDRKESLHGDVEAAAVYGGFKLEAARYVLDQGLSFAEVGKRLGVLPKLVRDWVVKYRGAAN